MHSSFAARLASRGVVQVSGQDSLRFLQGLVTNDVHAICGPSSPATSFSAFLNGRGRLLFGSLMHRVEDNWYLLDTPASKTADLIAHLRKYKLRSKVELEDVSDHHSVWSIVGAHDNAELETVQSTSGLIFNDPRLPELGKRAILEKSSSQFHSIPEKDEQTYETFRILAGVPDGTDFDGTPLPLDLALHLLNGVSFDKGCYLGQELTARSHFTGVLRKRITPVVITEDAASPTGPMDEFNPTELLSENNSLAISVGTKLFVDGRERAVGTVSSSSSNVGLAVVRLTDVFTEDRASAATVRLEDGRMGRMWTPSWWEERDSSAAKMEN